MSIRRGDVRFVYEAEMRLEVKLQRLLVNSGHAHRLKTLLSSKGKADTPARLCYRLLKGSAFSNDEYLIRVRKYLI